MGLLSRTARADTFNFTPICDLSWQTCCDCGVAERCVNWDVSPVTSPACPGLPTSLDAVMIGISCQIDPSPAQSAVAGSIIQSGGVFLLDGELVLDTTAVFEGAFLWQGGSLIRAGAPGATVALNGGMNISGSSGKNLGAGGPLFGGISLINPAMLTWTDAGSLTLGDADAGGAPSTIFNLVGGIIDARSNAPIVDTAFGRGRIENAGTILKSAGNGNSAWNVALVNDGLVHVQSGELHLTGGGQATGEFRTDSGMRLVFTPASPFEFLPGVTFTGDGEAVLRDTGQNSGVEIRQAVQINRFSVEDSGQIGPTSEADFGQIAVSESLTLSGAVIYPPIRVLENAMLIVAGPNASAVGDLVISGTAQIGGAQLASNQHSIGIDATGVVELGDDGSLASAGVPGQSIQNSGVVRKIAGAGVSEIIADADVAFENLNNARIEVTSGLLSFDIDLASSGEIQIGGGATLRALRAVTLNGGMVRGSGVIVADVNSIGATVAPGDSPGQLTIGSSDTPLINGNYTQGALAKLVIEVGGLGAGTQHDVLSVDRNAALDGTLEVTLIGGFTPQYHDTITILTAASITGAFATVHATNLPTGTSMEVNYGSGTVSLDFAVESNDNNNNNANENNNNNNSNSNDNDNENDNNNNDNNANANENENNNDNNNGNANENANSNDNDNDNVNGNNANGNGNTNSNGNANVNNNSNDNGAPNPSVTPNCGSGACGASTAAAFPLMIAGLGARVILVNRIRRRRRNRMGKSI